MQSQLFNNPAFAQGLSGLVESFIGNPARTAQAEEAASRALLNNQTAQFREAIGEAGLSGDLASAMIRALQAGPEFSGNAPRIGQAALQFGAAGFGPPQLTPTGPIAALMLRAMAGGGGRRGGRASGGGGGGGAPKRSVTDVTQGELNRAFGEIDKRVRSEELTLDEATQIKSSLLKQFEAGNFPTLDHGVAAILSGLSRETVEVPDPNNPAGTMLSRLFGLAGDGFEGSGFDPKTEERLVIPDLGIQNNALPQPGTGQLPAPKTLAEMQALPSGTRFIDPEGRVRIRP